MKNYDIPKCLRCADTGLDPRCSITEDGLGIEGYCNCSTGETLMNKEMCFGCGEMKMDCDC